MPQSDPVIIGAPKVLKPGEQVFLNCTSDFSLPPSDINWYIDEELQKVRIHDFGINLIVIGFMAIQA